MARLLTALVLLLAVTITLASLASTAAAARSARFLGNGMSNDGASGAVGTAGDITVESAPSVSQSSAGGELSRRKLQPGNTTPRQFPKGLNLFAKDGTLCVTVKNRDCAAPKKSYFYGFTGNTPSLKEIIECEEKRQRQIKECEQ